MDDLPELRAAVPALEPDAVLLGQLAELSAASAAADTAVRTRLRPARALITGAAALGLVAATSWIAGALPGVPSPIVPDEAPPPAPTAPATPHRTSDARVPSASAGPTSGASSPHAEAPGVVPPSRTAGGTRRAQPSAAPPGGHPATRPGQNRGQSSGQNPGQHRGQGHNGDQGRHRGQDASKPTHASSSKAAPHPTKSTSHPPDPDDQGRKRRPASDPTTGP